MSQNIIEKIEDFLKQQEEIPGNFLYFDRIKSEKKVEINNNLVEKDSIDLINNKNNDDFLQELNILKDNTMITKEEMPTKIKIEDFNENWKESKTALELKDSIKNCLKCPLGETRTNFVFGSGNHNADIMLIGEAPGADEDEQGLPFVGRAGQLLTKIIEAINLSREEVFICNIIKCRPPNNRKPLTSEVDECEPYLKKQIELIKPKFILLLGLTAAETLLKTNVKMANIRGNIVEYEGIKTLITYHPAALLRNPNWKPLVWEDVKLLRRLYDEYLNNKESK